MTTDELAQVSDNGAEELLPVTALENVIKATIGEARPADRGAMWEKYRAIAPDMVSVSPGTTPRYPHAGFSRASRSTCGEF